MTTSPPIWPAIPETALEVYLLGLVDFDACLFLQERLLMEVTQRDDGHGVLLVCEHPPLITIGREGSRVDIACSPEELRARQLDVRWLNRGGGAIVHMPGSLAIYPIIPLQRRDLGLADYRQRVELATVDVCQEMRVPAWQDPHVPGVTCRGGRLAQFGAAVRNWVSSHGMFLHVAPALQPLRLIRPETGDPRLTSIAAERLRPTSMAGARESAVRRFAERLDYQRYHVYTGHPLLRRTRRVVAYA